MSQGVHQNTLSPERDQRKVSLRLHTETYARVKYWAERSQMSINDFLTEAVEEKIARVNGDFDVPNLALARLNQVIDELKANSSNVRSLEQVVINMGASIMGLAKGDNYVLDAEEDGELPVTEVQA